MTDAQFEKWLGTRYDLTASSAFVEAIELCLDGDIDIAALRGVLADVGAAHDAFALRFPHDGSGQILEPQSQLPVFQLDLAGSADPETAYRELRDSALAEPVDLSQLPLAWAWVLRLSSRRVRLLFKTHHLVMDGWSMRQLLREMVVRYNARVSGTQRAMRMPCSWADYVRSERKLSDGELGQAALEYWKNQFASLPEPLRLPIDYPRPARLSFTAANVTSELSVEIWQGLRAVAREYKVTRFSLLLAVYGVMLHRLTGQNDFVCGVPFAGVTRGGDTRVIGDTDNTLPVRLRINPEGTLGELARQVQDSVSEAARHSHVSLGRIVDSLKLDHDSARMLLVEAVVVLDPTIDGLSFHGAECRVELAPRRMSAWELAWHWRMTPTRMVLELQYRDSLYATSTAQRWCDLYAGLVARLADVMESPIAEISADTEGGASDAMLSAPRLVEDAALPDLPSLLRVSFDRHPQRIAVQCTGDSLTYAELDRRSSVAAASLAAAGVGRGTLVGIHVPRSLDMLVAMIAILRAGGAYVPLDPQFPLARLEFVCTDAALTHVIVGDPDAFPPVLGDGREVLDIRQLSRPWSVDPDPGKGGGDVQELPDIDGNALAYVLYTSGSTGQPKGVRILHCNLVSFLLAMRETPGFDIDDVLVSATTISFDIAALELFLPLVCGGRVVIADEDEYRDPLRLCALFSDSGCTIFQTTPALLGLLHEVGRAQALEPLRLLVGGEALSATLAHRLVDGCREAWNMYGPTETTVWSSIARLQPGMDPVPLGKPIPGTRIHILDAALRPAWPGAIGEIWISGQGVADGYLDRPVLNTERFVRDPFANDGSCMYRTGDLGRIRDGILYFAGRADDQIKLRGYRIEPGEVEAVAGRNQAVIECVAVAREVAASERVLVLYVAGHDDSGSLQSSIRVALESALPGYMQPQYIVLLDKLPKTPNGKIDRRQLPLPSLDAPSADDAIAVDAPSDALESFLQGQWQRLLGIGRVGLNDNFFEIGGYSLIAVRMFADIQRRFGIELPLATLIGQPTIKGLASVMRGLGVDGGKNAGTADQLNADRRWNSLVPMQAHAVEDVVPLFLLHAVGGNVLNYLPLIRAMGASRPAYALQAAGLDGVQVPRDSISDMASHYASQVREAWPQGPYLLAGGSMGGVLALEVARHLRAKGGEVLLLAMFDTRAPDKGPGDTRNGRRSLSTWLKAASRMTAEQRRQMWQRIMFRAVTLPWAQITHRMARKSDALPPAVRIRQVEQAHFRALARYRPEPYPGDLLLYRALEDHGGSAASDGALGWRHFINGRIDVIDIPGRHDNFIDQPALARSLCERIEDVLATHGNGVEEGLGVIANAPWKRPPGDPG